MKKDKSLFKNFVLYKCSSTGSSSWRKSHLEGIIRPPPSANQDESNDGNQDDYDDGNNNNHNDDDPDVTISRSFSETEFGIMLQVGLEVIIDDV